MLYVELTFNFLAAVFFIPDVWVLNTLPVISFLAITWENVLSICLFNILSGTLKCLPNFQSKRLTRSPAVHSGVGSNLV